MTAAKIKAKIMIKNILKYIPIAAISAFLFIVFSISSVSAFIVSIFVRDKQLYYQRYSRFAMKLFFRLMGVRFIVSGMENIPPEGPFILVSNYQTEFDLPVVMALVKRKIKMTAHHTFFAFPFSVLSRPSGYLPLEQVEVEQMKKDMGVVIDKVMNGDAIFMFINLSATGKKEVERPVTGPAYVALKTKATVIPMSIDHHGKIDPLKNLVNLWIEEKMQIKVNIGKPVENNEIDDHIGRAKLSEKIKDEINRLLRL
jgi:1-acyl-sn-glycerol-3-phosphate acyltransferase